MIVVTKLMHIQPQKSGIFQFRMSIPKEVRKFLGQSEAVKSLHTRDFLEAKIRAQPYIEEWQGKIQDARTALAEAKSKKGKRPQGPEFKYLPIQSLMDSDAVERNLKEYRRQLAYQVQKFVPSIAYFRPPTLKSTLEELERVTANLKGCLGGSDVLNEEGLKAVKNWLIEESNVYNVCLRVSGLDNLSNTVLLRGLARRVIEILLIGYAQLKVSVLSALGKSPEPIPIQNDLMQVEVISPQAKTSPLLSEALEKYIETESPKKNTIKARRGGIKMFTDWAEDKPVAEYTADDVLDYRNNCLRKLPDRRKNSEKYKGKKLRQVVEMNSSDPCICTTRINDLLTSIRVVFRFAMTRDDWGVKNNPVSGMNEKKKGQSSRKKGRTSYSDAEVKKLFEILPYNEKKPSWYWSVLICLYNSFRISEICQLYVSDIVKKDGFWCFDINENDAEITKKSIKTDSTCRIVPVHPKLIEAGFLSYVEQRKKVLKKKDGLLFPNVTYYESDDGYGRTTSRWFNERFKKDFILEKGEKKKDFHSLRYTFGRYAKNRARLNKDAEKILMGHASDKEDEVHDIYTEAEIQFLYDELIRLDYGLKIPENPFIKKKTTK